MPTTVSGERCKAQPDTEVRSDQLAGATVPPTAVVVLNLLLLGLATLPRLAFLVPVCIWIACLDRSGEQHGRVGPVRG
jgi:hypothetical protein